MRTVWDSFEIKDCPFCGASRSDLCGVEPGRSLNGFHYTISCRKCSVTMIQDRADKVVGMWNQRNNSNR